MLLAYSRNHSTCLLWNSTFRSLSRFNSADPYSTCWRVKDTVAVQRITTELSLGRMNVMVLPSITRVQLRIFPGSLACHKPMPVHGLPSLQTTFSTQKQIAHLLNSSEKSRQLFVYSSHSGIEVIARRFWWGCSHLDSIQSFLHLDNQHISTVVTDLPSQTFCPSVGLNCLFIHNSSFFTS